MSSAISESEMSLAPTDTILNTYNPFLSGVEHEQTITRKSPVVFIKTMDLFNEI